MTPLQFTAPQHHHHRHHHHHYHRHHHHLHCYHRHGTKITHISFSAIHTVACIKKMHVLKTLFCENMDCAKRIVCDLMKRQILLQIHSSRQTVTGKGRFRQFAEEMHLLTRSSAEQDHIGQCGHYLICPRSYGYCGTVM